MKHFASLLGLFLLINVAFTQSGKGYYIAADGSKIEGKLKFFPVDIRYPNRYKDPYLKIKNSEGNSKEIELSQVKEVMINDDKYIILENDSSFIGDNYILRYNYFEVRVDGKIRSLINYSLQVRNIHHKGPTLQSFYEKDGILQNIDVEDNEEYRKRMLSFVKDNEAIYNKYKDIEEKSFYKYHKLFSKMVVEYNQ